MSAIIAAATAVANGMPAGSQLLKWDFSKRIASQDNSLCSVLKSKLTRARPPCRPVCSAENIAMLTRDHTVIVYDNAVRSTKIARVLNFMNRHLPLLAVPTGAQVLLIPTLCFGDRGRTANICARTPSSTGGNYQEAQRGLGDYPLV